MQEIIVVGDALVLDVEFLFDIENSGFTGEPSDEFNEVFEAINSVDADFGNAPSNEGILEEMLLGINACLNAFKNEEDSIYIRFKVTLETFFTFSRVFDSIILAVILALATVSFTLEVVLVLVAFSPTGSLAGTLVLGAHHEDLKRASGEPS